MDGDPNDEYDTFQDQATKEVYFMNPDYQRERGFEFLAEHHNIERVSSYEEDCKHIMHCYSTGG
jgi:hypothetical protein